MGDGVQIYSRRPELFQKLRDQPFNPQDYFAEGDNLHVRVWGAISSSIQFFYQLLLPEGRIITNHQLLATPTDRSSTTFFFNMPESILLGLMLNVEATAIPRGSIYCSVQTRRSAVSSGGAYRHLVHGYIDGTFSLQYPYPRSEPAFNSYGRPRTIVGSDPAAGAEVSETVPTNAMWRLLSMAVTIVCDATVATRTPGLALDDGTNLYYRGPVGQASTASQTTVYTFANVGASQGAGGVAAVQVAPYELYLPPASRIRTITNNLQAGDDYSAPVLHVMEWLVEA